MTRRHWVQLAACVAAAAIVALLVVALIKAGYACANPSKRVAFKIVEANGCFEFWLNRYQGAWSQLLAAGVALFAAALAWHAVQAQIAIQQRATELAEFDFWQSKLETSDAALTALAVMKTNLKALEAAIETNKLGQNVNVRVCNAMRSAGFFPFAPADTTAVGAESAYYVTFVSQLSGQISRLDANPGADTLVLIDRSIGGLFELFPPVMAAVDQATERHRRQRRKAEAALQRFDH